MSKRFTDTEKWKKNFIRGLQGPYKLLWLYLLDDCDHAGIWHVDMEVAQIRIGEKSISLEGSLEEFNGKIIQFDEGEKWFVPAFIEFQYGQLNEANRAHRAVIEKLKKYQLMGHISPLQGAMDKEKDKEKDMDKEKEPVVALEIASYLADSIKSWKPDYLHLRSDKITKTIRNWSEDIDKAIRIDERSPEILRQIIKWLPGHSNGKFSWRDQILSGAKLRVQFDKLQIGMDRDFKVEAKPLSAGSKEPVMFYTWTCPYCDKANLSNPTHCDHCKKKKPIWRCHHCKHLNVEDKVNCEKCKKPRPVRGKA